VAKNTGRGSRAAAQASDYGKFIKAKTNGGAFKGINKGSWLTRLLRRLR